VLLVVIWVVGCYLCQLLFVLLVVIWVVGCYLCCGCYLCQLLFVLLVVICVVGCNLSCSIYCLCVNVYCHRVTTQMQLINISYHIKFRVKVCMEAVSTWEALVCTDPTTKYHDPELKNRNMNLNEILIYVS
jgi:hypothetical protein